MESMKIRDKVTSTSGIAGSNDTGDNLSKLWISPHIFIQICNGPNGILGGPGETEKKLEVENLVLDSLSHIG